MYAIGDKILYPMHGAGIVETIEEKEILGECPCAGCRNFEKAIDILPADI